VLLLLRSRIQNFKLTLAIQGRKQPLVIYLRIMPWLAAGDFIFPAIDHEPKMIKPITQSGN